MKALSRYEFLERKRMVDAAWFLILPFLLIFIGFLWQSRLINIPFVSLLKANLILTGCYIALHLFMERVEVDMRYVRWLTLLTFFIILLQITATIHFLGGAEGFLFYPLYLIPIVASGILFSGWYPLGCAFISAGLLASLFLLEEPDFVWYLANLGMPGWVASVLERIAITDYHVFGFEIGPEVMLVILLTYLFISLAFAFLSQSVGPLLDRLYTLTASMKRDIQARENLFNLSLLHAPAGFIIGYRSNYRPIYVNKYAMDAFGLSEEDVRGKDLFSLLAFGQDMSSLLMKKIGAGEVVDSTIASIDVTGGMKSFFQTKLSFLNYPTATGEEGLFILIISNVTEEIELSNIITNFRDAMMLIDSSGKINFYNRAAMEAFPDLLKGMPLKQILSASRAFSADISAAILKGDTVDGKVSLKGKSFLFSSSLLKDVTGIELGILFSLKDITKEEVFYNLSIRDELTGVYNRRYFFEVLEKELAQAQRYPKRLSLAIMDIDFFKKVNDTYGHNAGDLVLKTFARTISSALRKADIFARVGGEEFSLYMPFTDLDGAENICNKIRREVEGLSITFEGNAIPVTCSIGVAEYAKEEGITQLTAKADAALYEAKNCGRNRVVIFSESILAKAGSL